MGKKGKQYLGDITGPVIKEKNRIIKNDITDIIKFSLVK